MPKKVRVSEKVKQTDLSPVLERDPFEEKNVRVSRSIRKGGLFLLNFLLELGEATNRLPKKVEIGGKAFYEGASKLEKRKEEKEQEREEFEKFLKLQAISAPIKEKIDEEIRVSEKLAESIPNLLPKSKNRDILVGSAIDSDEFITKLTKAMLERGASVEEIVDTLQNTLGKELEKSYSISSKESRKAFEKIVEFLIDSYKEEFDRNRGELEILRNEMLERLQTSQKFLENLSNENREQLSKSLDSFYDSIVSSKNFDEDFIYNKVSEIVEPFLEEVREEDRSKIVQSFVDSIKVELIPEVEKMSLEISKGNSLASENYWEINNKLSSLADISKDGFTRIAQSSEDQELLLYKQNKYLQSLVIGEEGSENLVESNKKISEHLEKHGKILKNIEKGGKLDKTVKSDKSGAGSGLITSVLKNAVILALLYKFFGRGASLKYIITRSLTLIPGVGKILATLFTGAGLLKKAILPFAKFLLAFNPYLTSIVAIWNALKFRNTAEEALGDKADIFTSVGYGLSKAVNYLTFGAIDITNLLGLDTALEQAKEGRKLSEKQKKDFESQIRSALTEKAYEKIVEDLKKDYPGRDIDAPLLAHRITILKRTGKLIPDAEEGVWGLRSEYEGISEKEIAYRLERERAREAASRLAKYGTVGSIAAKYESGGDSTTVVADKGGIAYGKYQIHSSTMPDFLKYLKENTVEVYGRLAYHRGSIGELHGGFAEEWKQLAREGKIQEWEQKFAEEVKFAPALKKAKEVGYKVENQAIKEMIFSAAIQHGGVKNLIDESVEIARSIGKDISQMSVKDQILTFYEARKRYGERFAPGYGLSNRYAREARDVLELSSATRFEAVGGTSVPTLIPEGEIVNKESPEVTTPRTLVEEETSKVVSSRPVIQPTTIIPNNNIGSGSPREYEPGDIGISALINFLFA